MQVMYTQSTPIPVDVMAHTCILMQMEGWETVSVIPVGAMQMPARSITLPGQQGNNHTVAVVILVKKEYTGAAPKFPVIDYSKKIPGVHS